MVGYWGFNGNANDESGNNNNGTVNGATLTTDRFGNSNGAYSFDGNQQNIVIQNNNSLNTNSITINVWALPLQDNITIIEKSDLTNAAQQGFAITHNDFWEIQRGLKSMFGNGACNIPSAPNVWGNYNHISNNLWSMITVSIDLNGNVKQYINGVLDYTETITPLITCNIPSAPLRIGGQHWNDDTEWMNGKLDDIAIYNRALTQEEITNLYYAENSCQSLVINTGVLSFNPPTYNNTVTIYPNPANDHITIDCGNLANVSGWSIKIFNTLGQEVFSGAMNTQQYLVPLNTWSGQGVYFVKIYDASNHLMNTKKIILQ